MKLVKSVLSASILAAAAQSAVAVEITPYAGIQMHYLFEDGSSWSGDAGWQDSYSRAGIKFSEDIGNIAVSAKFEYSIDPTGEVDFENTETQRRIGVIKASGDFGTIGYGKDFQPFYNAVVWGTGSDRFLGYNTGWQARFIPRVSDTFYYTTPDLDGLQIATAFSADDAGTYAEADRPNNKEIAATYVINDNFTTALAWSDGDTARQKRTGAGIKYTRENWLATLNFQESDDGNEYINAYTSYSIDDTNTVHFHLSEDNGNNTNPFTLGYKYKYDGDLTLFAEYYDDDAGGEYPSIGFHYNL
jgi:predicted porin